MRKIFTRAAIAAAVLAGFSTAAHSYVIVRLIDAGADNVFGTGDDTTVTCNNQAAACSGSFTSAIGGSTVLFSGTVGVFTVASTFGITNTPGTPTGASIDQSSTRISNTAGGIRNFMIDFTAFDYSQPAGVLKNLNGSATESAVPTPSGSVTTSFYADATNAGGTTNAISCLMTITSSSACTAPTLLFNAPGPLFSLREVQQINFTSGGDVNTTANLNVTVPEPMSTALVGVALCALALTTRKRKSING